VLLLLGAIVNKTVAQDVSNIRKKEIALENDTISLDSFSIVPNSEIITWKNKILQADFYEIDYTKGVFYLKNSTIRKEKVTITYRVFPLSLEESYEHKAIKSIKDNQKITKNPFFKWVKQKWKYFKRRGIW
jgi:hypothetical protein